MSIKPYSEEWYWLRSHKIGASDVPCLMHENPWKSSARLLQEKLGFKESEPMNAKMKRGLDLEDKARDWFYDKTGMFVMPYVVISEKYEWAFASLDGLTIYGDAIVEIKCPNKKTHDIAKKGEIPSWYYGQLQHQICVTEPEKAYYVSFDGEDGIIIEVARDDKYIENMLAMEKEFYSSMQFFNEKKFA